MRCNDCGRFISYESIDLGTAKVRFITPDSEYTAEDYECLCAQCNREEQHGNSNKEKDNQEDKEASSIT